MALTLIPSRPSSVARFAVSDTRAYLLVPYAPPLENAPADAMLTILPPPRARMLGTTACEQTSGPLTLTAITRSHHSIGNVESGENGISAISAAQLTRMSTPPYVAVAVATTAAADAGSVTSKGAAVTASPLAARSPPRSFAPASFRSPSTTDAPRNASSRPNTAPMPPAPPVMTATLP